MKRLVFGLISLAACSKEAPAPTKPLLSEVREALVARDAKLRSYRIEVDTTQLEDHAHHRFAFKSPNKSHGEIMVPVKLEMRFDGHRLLMREGEGEPIERPLPGEAEQKAFLLASTFDPFVPEGFRTPLLPTSGVEAKRVGVDQVELTVHPAPDVTVVDVLRLPAGDFLGKRTTAGGVTRVLKVTTEHCQDGLCVPTALEERIDAQLVGQTSVTTVEWNPDIPDGEF